MNTYPKHLPAEQRRAIIIEVVIKLAAEQNPSDITTAAIAQGMGLTQGALFRHFPTKESILEAVMHWVAEHLLARLDQAVEGINSPLAALEAVFMAHIQFVSEHPGIPRLLFAELQRSGDSLPKQVMQNLIQHYLDRLNQLMTNGKAQNEIKTELDIDIASISFIGSIQGLILQSLIANDTERMRRDARGVFAIYLDGIRS